MSWMCVLGALPFAVMGFVKYNGMTAEQFVFAFSVENAAVTGHGVNSNFFMP